MQTKIALVKILQNFKVSASGKTNIPVTFEPSSVFQTPVGGMWLRLEKLN